MKTIKNIIAAIMLLAIIYICAFAPFGEGTSWQWVANIASIFVGIPAALGLSDFPRRMHPEYYGED